MTRALRILFLALLGLWLNVLLPGHTRGQITLGDAACAKPAAEKAAASCCEPKPAPGEKPTPEQCGRCAVCYVAMTTELTPPFTFDASLSENVIATIYATDPQRRAIHLDLHLFATGPPTALA